MSQQVKIEPESPKLKEDEKVSKHMMTGNKIAKRRKLGYTKTKSQTKAGICKTLESHISDHNSELKTMSSKVNQEEFHHENRLQVVTLPKPQPIVKIEEKPLRPKEEITLNTIYDLLVEFQRSVNEGLDRIEQRFDRIEQRLDRMEQRSTQRFERIENHIGIGPPPEQKQMRSAISGQQPESGKGK